MTGSAKMLALLAVGWSMLAVSLAQVFPVTALSLTLGTVVFAECFSALILTRALPNAPARARADQDDLAGALLGWVLLCVLFALLFHLRLISFFQGQPAAMLCLLALTLVLVLLKHFAKAHPLARFLQAMRLVAPAALAIVLDRIGGATPGLFLASLVLSHLVTLLIVVLLARKPRCPLQPSAYVPPLQVLAAHADLLLVPILLNGTEALLYIAARGLGIVVTGVLAQLGARAMPALLAAGQSRNQSKFITIAARLNLGFLLVGGSAGIAALTVGPYVAKVFHLAGADFQAALLWVVLGACAPAIFGATEALLQMIKKRNLLLLSDLVAVGGFTSAILFVPQPDALLLAKCFAVVQLLKTAACAVLLVRHAGVWPGLTALLLRQIKLF